MAKRKIIKIERDKCNGCGLCIPNCPEGAIQVIDGKARLVSDLFCDGLGACLGHCPQGAITIEERDAQEYDEEKVMENIAKQGRNVINAHLEHLKGHGQNEYFEQALEFLHKKGIKIPADEQASGAHHGHGACPGSKIMDFKKREGVSAKTIPSVTQEPQLVNWPVQLKLVPVHAPYFKDADLLICADCLPFAYADFHENLLKGKVLLVGCPKLDDSELYTQKIKEILKDNQIKSVTYAHMEVPCCFGLVGVIQEAIAACGKQIPFKEVIISIKGKRLQ